MEISIENFRHYTSKRIFKFSQNLNLLKGVSGSGKSTICAAITWCLYNKPATKNKPFQKPKSVINVTLKFNSFTVQRESPGDLILTFHDQTQIKGDSAQEHINSVFGDFLVWNTCSYMGQNTKNPLIMASSSDKFAIMNSLMKHDDIKNKIVSYTSKVISENSKQLDILTNKISFLSSRLKTVVDNKFRLSDIEAKIAKHKELFLKLTKEKAVNDSNHKRRKEIKASLEKLQTDETFESVELQESENAKHKDFQSLTLQLKKIGHVPSNYQELILELSSIISESSKYQKATEGYDIQEIIEYEQTREQIILDNTKFEKLNFELKTEFDKTFHELTLQKQKLLFSQENLKSESKKFKEFTQKLEDYLVFSKLVPPTFTIEEIFEKINELKSSKLDLVCPNCSAEVHLRDSELFLGKQGDINKELRKFNKLKTDFYEYTNLKVSLENFDPENKVHDPTNKLLQIEKDLKEINSNLSKKLVFYKLRSVPVSKAHILSVKKPERLASKEDFELFEQLKKGTLYFDLKNKLKKLENPVFKDVSKDLKILKSIEQLTKELAKIPEYNSKLNSELEKSESSLEKYSELRTQCIEFEENAKIKTEHDLHFDQFKLVSSELSDNKKLKEITEGIYYQTFETITNTFSIYLNDFLKYVFDDPIEIRIKTQKQEKNQVYCEIKYANANLENFSSFSGGELARISLGLTLALAKIQNSQILILDEVMSSLNEDLQTRCIKQVRKNNIIIIHICHESVEGNHDNVIDLTCC